MAFGIGLSSALLAELHAITAAIEFSKEQGLTAPCLWLECDSLLAVSAINHNSLDIPLCLRNRRWNCMRHIKSINFHCSHIYREGNHSADRLANWGTSSQSFQWWSSPPQFLWGNLSLDSAGALQILIPSWAVFVVFQGRGPNQER